MAGYVGLPKRVLLPISKPSHPAVPGADGSFDASKVAQIGRRQVENPNVFVPLR